MESINPPSHLAGEFEVEHAASDTVTDVTADANAAGACVTLGWLRGLPVPAGPIRHVAASEPQAFAINVRSKKYDWNLQLTVRARQNLRRVVPRKLLRCRRAWPTRFSTSVSS
jgi:hypothetical protein